MLRILTIAAAFGLFTAGGALAGPGNSDAAKGMASQVGSSATGATASSPSVSGESQRENSGWGNAGGVVSGAKSQGN